MEGEPGYCRDHLEMREKDAGVLTEDTGRFGGSPRMPSPVLGAEPPLECAPVPPSVSQCHHQGWQDTANANPALGATPEHKRHQALSYKDIIEQLHARKLHPHTHSMSPDLP